MGVVHSSHDTIYVQEVEQLEKQKNEAKDEEGRKVIEKKIAIKRLERDLASSKTVRQRNLTLRQMLYAMKLSLVVLFVLVKQTSSWFSQTTFTVHS